MVSPSGAFNELAEQLLIGRALEHAANPVALLDRAARVVWSNKAYSSRVEEWRPTGTSSGVPQVSASISLVCQRLQDAMGPNYRELWNRLNAGDRWSGEVTLEPIAQPGSGAIFDYILSPLPDAKGRAAYFLLLLHDVTAHHTEKLLHSHAAHHDSLTGLGNRLCMSEALADLFNKKDDFAIFYMDLDGFKGVNDNFGHATGDDVLKAFAQHLKYVCRDSDIPIRLGGDEFVVILPGKSSEEDLHAIADRFLTTAKLAFASVAGILVDRLGVSIGGARFPLDGLTQECLMESADSALYQAKRAGKGRFVLREPDVAI